MNADDHAASAPLFEWVCRQPDLEASIAGLPDDALRALHHYLGFLPASGIPGLIHGLVISQAASRFLTPP